ncbi:MAG: hypothetical protein RI897_2357 [Verrucomicrobiota bacterium]
MVGLHVIGGGDTSAGGAAEEGQAMVEREDEGGFGGVGGLPEDAIGVEDNIGSWVLGCLQQGRGNGPGEGVGRWWR